MDYECYTIRILILSNSIQLKIETIYFGKLKIFYHNSRKTDVLIMDELDNLATYNGDTEHDMWVDFTIHENTGELGEYFNNADEDG